jgi:hypothetical protein
MASAVAVSSIYETTLVEELCQPRVFSQDDVIV